MIQRRLRFRLTVRDNLATGIGGGVAFDETLIEVVGNTLPFEITSNNNNWTVGSSKLISWQVGNTNQAPINAKNVSILLSTDGGTTFPHVLANQTDIAAWGICRKWTFCWSRTMKSMCCYFSAHLEKRGPAVLSCAQETAQRLWKC